MRRTRETLILGLCLALLFSYAGSAKAESTSSGGAPTTARLDFQITIPTILYLQVGSLGTTIDVVTFPNPPLPGTGTVAANSGPVTVRVAALVGTGGTATLRADSLSSPLTAGSNTIPFTEISWAATGGFTSTSFNGTANQQLDVFTGPGNRQGTYSFTYANAGYYAPGDYNGQVTYTLSSP